MDWPFYRLLSDVTGAIAVSHCHFSTYSSVPAISAIESLLSVDDVTFFGKGVTVHASSAQVRKIVWSGLFANGSH